MAYLKIILWKTPPLKRFLSRFESDVTLVLPSHCCLYSNSTFKKNNPTFLYICTHFFLLFVHKLYEINKVVFYKIPTVHSHVLILAWKCETESPLHKTCFNWQAGWVFCQAIVNEMHGPRPLPVKRILGLCVA